jgi:hypothetical protein
VFDDDAHCGDMMIGRSALSPSSPRLRRAALCGFGLDRSARPSKFGDRAANAFTAMLDNQGKRLSDNVRQVECWFSRLGTLSRSSTSPEHNMRAARNFPVDAISEFSSGCPDATSNMRVASNATTQNDNKPVACTIAVTNRDFMSTRAGRT